MSNKTISIKEIAKLANVSVATVSRVINNNGRFSEETRKKVQAVIDKYGYTTNMAAKSLRMSKSKTIGIIVPNINNEWFSQVVLVIEKFFFERNYSVFICNTSQDEDKEISYFKSLDSKLVDGIICISGREDIPTNVIKRSIPIVCIDRKPKDNSDAFYVESDHYYGGYLATKELLDRGCKDILIVSRNKTLSVNQQRLEGYKKALQDSLIPIRDELILLLDKDSSNFEGARTAVSNILENGIKFDGVFATNDWRAYGALMALKEKDIKVPEEVKIVGFDDITISKYCYPSLSTIQQNTDAICEKASNLLLDLMEDNHINNDVKHITIPVSLIKRETTK
ncbi:MAG: LacI family DNA-binding transcriptional regulator [Coprobacillaceae bacterium]